MLKKIVSLMIILTLFLGLVPVGYGNVKSSILTKTEVEDLVRERLNLGEEYKLQYSNLYTQDRQEKQVWNLSFEKKDQYLSVAVAAATGEIISMNQWDNEAYGKAVTLFSDEAKKIAIEFITSLERDKFKETEEVTVQGPSAIIYDLHRSWVDQENYHFMFVRKIKGEFFPNNYFRVSVSGVSGKILSYEMKWDQAVYKGDKDLLSENKVRELFEKEDRLQLKYVRLNKYNQEEREKFILTPVYVYVPIESDKIDAITGRLLTREELYNQGYIGIPYGDVVAGKMEEAADGILNEVIPEAGVISKEKAEEIIRDLLKGHVDLEGIYLDSTRYTNYYRGMKGKFWLLYYYTEEGAKSLGAVVNAETGKVLEVSYYKNNGYEPLAMARDWQAEEDSKKKAISTEEVGFLTEKIQAIFPETEGQLKIEINSKDGKDGDQISGSSSRYFNSIPYEDNYVSVTYNLAGNEITSLNYRWYDVELQKSHSLLSSEKAHKIFYDHVGFEKYLIQLKDVEKYESDRLHLPKKELLPVYGIKSFGFNYIHGITGQFLDYAGEEFKEDETRFVEFIDIEDSPYKREILLMDKMGILKVEGEAFRPGEALLRKDALKWIMEMGWANKVYYIERYYNRADTDEEMDYFKDVAKDSPYYKYVQAAVDSGIIDHKEAYFRPDEKISKIELTKWMIHAMKQKELASYSGIFQIPYEDKEAIRAEDVGYVALAKYYNIFGDKSMEGEFSPNKNFNRGEFIYHMYQLIGNF